MMAWMLVHPQIHNIFASLGVQQGDAYRVGEDCLAVLGDIFSKLSVEDRTLRTFRRAIGFGQHIRKDLMPLLIHVKDDAHTKDATKILDATIKILVNLTIPVDCLLSMDAMSKTDMGRHTIFEINKLLYSSKEAFVDSRSIKAVTDHMKFVIERGAKLESEQCDSINNCLLLLRNILHIPEYRMQISNCPLAHSSMQNRILWNLFTQSIDKLLLHLMTFPQKIYWVVTMVQLIALMYKDQHVGTLQKLLSAWFEHELSDSSDDNESNTSPAPANATSGDSSPMLTSSDPTTSSSDSSDTAGPRQHVNRSQQNRNKVLLTTHKQRTDDSSSSSSDQHHVQGGDNNKKEEQMQRASGCCANLRAQKRKHNRNELLSIGSTSTVSDVCATTPKTDQVQSELSDYGYGTQVENQESISTSSNDDDAPAPHQKPVHQKPHMVQKPRNKARNTSPQDKKDLRKKKLIKRSKVNINLLKRPPSYPEVSLPSDKCHEPPLFKLQGIINIKGLLHHSPSDEDISNILKEFTVDFLLRGYGSLVHELYVQLLSPRPVQVDTSHIFWLVTYFLKFATQLELDLEMLESVLSFHILAYLVYEGVNLCEQLEMSAEQGSGSIKPCLRRMHLVVTAIKEFLQSIETYRKIPTLSLEHQERLRTLQIQVASTGNLKCLLLLLLRQFNPKTQSKQYLQDLVVTNHILLLFLDDSAKVVGDTGSGLVDHLKHFANVEVMHQYGLLLEDFEDNGKFINDCIFTMMHHIGGDIDHVAILFQPVILKTFSKIWESDYEICDDWSDLIEYVIHKFINVPRQPTQRSRSPSREPAIGIEVIAPLSPQIKNENIDDWTEEEIDALYCHYTQSRQTPNIISNISKLYLDTGVTKSPSSIIHQLHAQNLISASEHQELLHISRDIQILKEQLVREGRGNAILWLQKLLLEACHCKVMLSGREREGDIYEPVPYCYIKLCQSIPVVAWYAEHSAILKNKSFIALIHKLGFHLPCDTQKLFVRIPHFWTAAHMYSAALKLGPLDPESLKFDVSLLADDAILDLELLSDTPSHIKEEEETTTSVSGKKTHPYLLPSSSSNWCQAVLNSKFNDVLDTHNAQTQSVSDKTDNKPPKDTTSSEENNPIVSEVPTPVEATSNSPAETAPQVSHADDEHNSICETASVTSDLTRMCVSDEDEKP